jgi:hypothetical protein
MVSAAKYKNLTDDELEEARRNTTPAIREYQCIIDEIAYRRSKASSKNARLAIWIAIGSLAVSIISITLAILK